MSEVQAAELKPARLSVATMLEEEDAFPDFSDPNLFSANSPDLESPPLTANSTAVRPSQSVRSSIASCSYIVSPGSSSTGGLSSNGVASRNSIGGLASASASTSSGSKVLLLPLPLPTLSTSSPNNNMSQTSFTLSEVEVDGEDFGLGMLPPEIATADISISADGSFVETTSGPAARELKRRYDHFHGVNKDVRSPYIITAIINQHGKQVYRVGMRSQAQNQGSSLTPELELPAPTNSSSGSISQAQKERRSKRMSITSVFKSVSTPQRVPDDAKSTTSSSKGSAGTEGMGGQTRKLRKPRSIPDLISSATNGYFGDHAPPTATGRAHSHSVTGADMPRPIIQTVNAMEPSARPSGDVFSNVMGWAVPPTSPLTSGGMTPSSHSLLTPSDTPSQSPLEVCSQHSKELLEHPFGRNVSFDSPFRTSAIYLPSIIREMQSFESARTARAGPQVPVTEEPVKMEEENVESEAQQRPDSLDSLASSKSGTTSTIGTNSDSLSESNSSNRDRAVPLPESCMYTRYPTSVFDVIQNYRGLPMLDSLSASSRQPTIKMSLSTIDGAVPRDDPRFVIWGDVSAMNDNASVVESLSGHSHSRPQSHTFSVASRKRSLKGKSLGMPEVREPSPVRGNGGEAGGSSADGTDNSRRVLMAATIERWIAQLTSQFDYDELLIFFLTYRTYIDSMDLCHLLICRFHWALEEPMSPQEIIVKQIVRVRTFVAIRYWLLTFFRIDFLPNRELCLLFANWLNTLWRDPILDKYSDARNIVKKLKKIAKDCKDAHSRTAKSRKKAEKKSGVMQSIDKILGDLSNGVNFAATLRKVSEAQHEEDSDVDLDFNPEESSPFSDATGIQGFASFANQLGSGEGPSTVAGRTSLSSSDQFSTPSSPPRPSTGPTSSRILLQQPLHLTILQHARAIQPGGNLPLTDAPSTLPVHHSSLSRVVVNTIGRLGRWKRVLSSRTPTTPVTPAGDISAFDLELNAAGDRFTVRGGVEQYLKMIDPPTNTGAENEQQESSATNLPEVKISVDTGSSASDNEKGNEGEEEPPTPSPQDTEPASRTPLASHAELRPETPGLASHSPDNDSLRSHSPGGCGNEPFAPVHRMLSRLRSTDRASSVHSGSSGSLRSLGNPLPKQLQSFPDIVSIDDLDYLSDNSSDAGTPVVPPGLGLRPTKRLPNRRDFEFVHRSVDSVSSMGIISHTSMALSDQASSSHSSYSASRGPPGLGNAVQQWQMNALIDDLSDDDNVPGDVDAALKRLEGQINKKQQKHKEQKVDGWVKTIQKRMALGDFEDEPPRNMSDDEGEEDGFVDENGCNVNENEDLTVSLPRTSLDSSVFSGRGDSSSLDATGNLIGADPITPTPRQTVHALVNGANASATAVASHVQSAEDAKPKIDEAVPEEILLSRLPSQSSSSSNEMPMNSPPSKVVGLGNGGQSNQAPMLKNPSHPTASTSTFTAAHRSFIMNYRSETLAYHFGVIDREIFLGIKFEELVNSDEWMRNSSDECNVYDWMRFLRERRRKAELSNLSRKGLNSGAGSSMGGGKGKISVLSAARARFNLVVGFVVSEIALTIPHDRVYVVSKFIRMAWKAYTQNNFATLVAIITGLSSDWVRKSMKRSWNRIGTWEIRVFNDLKAFCSADDDFGCIRRAITALVDAKPLDASEGRGRGQQEDENTSCLNGAGETGGSKGRTGGDGKGMQPPISCVPFIGVYLSQLHRFQQLPDLIDPSAPTETVDIDPETGNFKAAAHPEVFSDLRPLPASMQIEPLINVQKQRMIAGVIKSLVAGQHLANKHEVGMAPGQGQGGGGGGIGGTVGGVDKRLLNRCLRLTALEHDALQRIFGVYVD